MKCKIKMFPQLPPFSLLPSYKNCFSSGAAGPGWTAFISFRHCEAWDSDGASQGRGGDFLYFVIRDKRAGSFVSHPHTDHHSQG